MSGGRRWVERQWPTTALPSARLVARPPERTCIFFQAPPGSASDASPDESCEYSSYVFRSAKAAASTAAAGTRWPRTPIESTPHANDMLFFACGAGRYYAGDVNGLSRYETRGAFKYTPASALEMSAADRRPRGRLVRGHDLRVPVRASVDGRYRGDRRGTPRFMGSSQQPGVHAS